MPIAVAPETAPQWMGDAVIDAGEHLCDISNADGLIWGDARNPQALSEVLSAHPGIRWVQLPFAGIENFMHIIDSHRVWTCGKGVYAEPVAEHALSLILAGLRHIHGYARSSSWSGPVGRNLFSARVTILGGGGITTSLIRLLEPFGCSVTVVRKHPSPVEGAHRVLTMDHLHDALRDADVVVLALALTAETEGVIAHREFSVMQSHAWIVNVARGRHVVTDDLIDALSRGEIGGAALDVTDPEPLPTDHRLWDLPNCIITPHIGNTPEMAVPLLSERITANVRRFIASEPLIGTVSPTDGY